VIQIWLPGFFQDLALRQVAGGFYLFKGSPDGWALGHISFKYRLDCAPVPARGILAIGSSCSAASFSPNSPWPCTRGPYSAAISRPALARRYDGWTIRLV
jgi:hypothetical protein